MFLFIYNDIKYNFVKKKEKKEKSNKHGKFNNRHTIRKLVSLSPSQFPLR